MSLIVIEDSSAATIGCALHLLPSKVCVFGAKVLEVSEVAARFIAPGMSFFEAGAGIKDRVFQRLAGVQRITMQSNSIMKTLRWFVVIEGTLCLKDGIVLSYSVARESLSNTMVDWETVKQQSAGAAVCLLVAVDDLITAAELVLQWIDENRPFAWTGNIATASGVAIYSIAAIEDYLGYRECQKFLASPNFDTTSTVNKKALIRVSSEALVAELEKTPISPSVQQRILKVAERHLMVRRLGTVAHALGAVAILAMGIGPLEHAGRGLLLSASASRIQRAYLDMFFIPEPSKEKSD